jgi:hypothetical protein
VPNLQERLDEFKKSFESGAPPYNTPHQAAPSFTLFNQDHIQVASADLLRQGPLVVSFFRGHW